MTSTADKKILVTYPEPWIAQVTLNIPKKYNAMTMELYRDLGAILRDIAVNDQILVTMLTGNGVFFSAYVLSRARSIWTLIPYALHLLHPYSVGDCKLTHPLIAALISAL
jgi:hypothetical protein